MADPGTAGAHASGTTAILAAFLANLGIAVAKLVGFVFTSSSAMLAESVHSFADTGNQALLLFGGKSARRAPSREHPFGYGRERYFWAFVVAVVLFTLGSVFALYEGIDKLRHPHELESPLWAIGILTGAIVLECASLWTAIAAANPLRNGASWWSFIRNSKAPELPVVLLEDAAALFGLVIALVAVGVAMITDNARWDGAGTVAIGLLLGVIAIVLAIEMRSLLIGEAASTSDLEAITETIGSSPHVERLIHMKTQHLGPDELLVAAKVAFPPDLTFRDVAVAIDELEARVRERVPYARAIYVEPDVDRTRDETPKS
jgi:cation diffusion facilitator family transporter